MMATATRLDVGRDIGIPASELCMMRGIYRAIQLEEHFDTSTKVPALVFLFFFC